MKKNCYAIIIASTICVLSGCKEEVCKSYAPAYKEISWTDYNTVNEVNAYFECYRETVRQHIGDTMKVVGYIAPGYQGINVPFDYRSHITASGNLVYLAMGDYYDVPKDKQGIVFLNGYLGEHGSNDVEIFSKFQNYQWGQKVYATVIIVARSRDWNYCCDYLACRPIEIEIENKEETK